MWKVCKLNRKEYHEKGNKKMNKTNHGNKLAIRMALAMVIGLVAGTGFLVLRETLLAQGNSSLWQFINNLLFQDITAEGANQAIGLFYILGQLFVNALQVIIVPMVFTSIALAICHITEPKKLGRISGKTLGIFLLTSIGALSLAGVVGWLVYTMGGFNVGQVQEGLQVAAGSTGSNPLRVFLDIIPNNMISAFSINSKVLSVVFLAVATGLGINGLKGKVKVLKTLLQEISDLITICLSYVISHFGPWAIFILLTRTFAIYGIEHLKPALTYVVTTVILLLVFLLFGYAFFIVVLGRLNPMPFIKKMSKVAVFGFSTSSSAATLPLNRKTTVEELGVSDEIASFTLPLGMTINMNGTAIMQVIAAIFIAASSGYEITFSSIAITAVLALIASVGTPAAPGAGAVILFTILTGMGYTNDAALLAYSLILAINRPIEMLVTSLNVVGDAATAVIVAKSENLLDEKQYHN